VSRRAPHFAGLFAGLLRDLQGAKPYSATPHKPEHDRGAKELAQQRLGDNGGELADLCDKGQFATHRQELLTSRNPIPDRAQFFEQLRQAL
jgi:hypothetical protein